MRLLGSLVLAGVVVVSGCAHEPVSKTSAATNAADPVANAPAVKDLKSFHLADPEAPEIVDQELNVIPTEVNPAVDMWVQYFQGKGRRHMERYLARSTRYEPLMKKVLRENGLPEDLFYIALIESGFSSAVVSHASAVGYWQFIRGTGSRYGLEINKLVDERRDPVLATQAAAEYFKGLYSVFGSWYLAMASYNVGENRVKKETMKHETRDFWELARKGRFPKETLNYIPKFIAAKMIAKNPAKYGFVDLDYLQPVEYDTVVLEKPANMRMMADKMNYNYEDLKAMNPRFKGEVAPLSLKDNKLELRIPVGQRDLAIAAANESVPEKVEYIADADTQAYKIRRGDNLSTVARKFRTTVAYLRDLNDISKGRRLKLGQIIYVPDRSPVRGGRANSRVARLAPATKSAPSAAETSAASENTSSESAGTAGNRVHVVRTGDSLFTIAKRYGTTVQEISRANNLRRGKLLKIGMKLRIPGDQPTSAASPSTDNRNAADRTKVGKNSGRIHVVRRGENLVGIADKYQVSVTSLRKTNRLREPANLLAGARLIIPQAQVQE